MCLLGNGQESKVECQAHVRMHKMPEVYHLTIVNPTCGSCDPIS